METAKTTRNGGFLPSIWSDLFNGDRFFDSRWPLAETVFSPPANVIETETSFRIELAAPGFSKNDFTVDAEENILSVKAEKNEERNEEEEHYTRREFTHTSFSRSFTLPQNADDARIEATYADGILSLEIPKKESSKSTPKKQIPVS
jgi:HSP20 family protein